MFQLNETALADYDALYSGCGFVELGHCTTVAITGADRATFLQNMCTNDIRRLATGGSCEAFFTDVKGKIVVHGLVIAQEERHLLVTVHDQADSLISHLDRYIIREDVQLADLSADICWIVISGQLNVAQLDGLDDSVTFASKQLPEMQLISSPTSSKSNVISQLQATDKRPCSLDALNILRIESKLPLFEVDFTSANLPQEVDRDEQAISFNKGCYLGQETIARIDALGHVNQKLVLLQFCSEVVPPTGLELRADTKMVGNVTSSCWSPRNQSPLALALIRRESNAVGTQLESAIGAATVIEPT